MKSLSGMEHDLAHGVSIDLLIALEHGLLVPPPSGCSQIFDRIEFPNPYLQVEVTFHG